MCRFGHRHRRPPGGVGRSFGDEHRGSPVAESVGVHDQGRTGLVAGQLDTDDGLAVSHVELVVTHELGEHYGVATLDDAYQAETGTERRHGDREPSGRAADDDQIVGAMRCVHAQGT